MVSVLKSAKRDTINWFPGHMYRALRLMKEYTSNIDIFVEIRDARVPISSRNDEFDNLILEHNKKKFIVFNKFDLSNKRVTQKLIEGYNAVGIPCIAISAKEGHKLKNALNDMKTMSNIKFSTVG